MSGADGCSPDGFVQMAIQLAYFRLKKKTVSTYESASTSAFLHVSMASIVKAHAKGRTEVIRSATPHSAAFVAAMLDGTLTNEAKAAALKKAIQTHRSLRLCGGQAHDAVTSPTLRSWAKESIGTCSPSGR